MEMEPILSKDNLSSSTKQVTRPPSLEIVETNYNPPIHRKLMEAICDTSTNTLNKLEKEGLIKSSKMKVGRLDFVTYSPEEIPKVLNYKKKSFKQREEAEVIAVFSQKGGVGKSAITQHLSSTLSLVGKTLVIDMDAQSDATILLGLDGNYGDLVEEDHVRPTIAEMMDWTTEDGSDPEIENLPFEEIAKRVSHNLFVIPADLELGEINYSLNRMPLQPRYKKNGTKVPAELVMVNEVIEKLKYHFDFIIFDCPPNIETCNVSALYASNRILIPIELEAKTLTTMRRNFMFLKRLNNYVDGFNWDKILVVRNKMRSETIKSKASNKLVDIYEDSDFVELSDVVLPNSSIIDKCSDEKKPIYAMTSRLGTDSRHNIHQAMEFTNSFWAIMHDILDIELEKLLFKPEEYGVKLK